MNSQTSTTIDQSHFDKLLGISNKLLKSLYSFDRPSVWDTVTTEIQRLFECELATLFLVDESDPDRLSLNAQSPKMTTTSRLTIPIESEIGMGITAHAAKIGQTLMLDESALQTNPYVSTKNPTYLDSGLCYSVLFVPLKNRKGRLIGLLRLHNKCITQPHLRSAFTPADKSTIEILATEIVSILENANAHEALRKLISDIQKAASTNDAVQVVLNMSTALCQADFTILALWSPNRQQLAVAGAQQSRHSRLAKPVSSTVVEAGNVILELWKYVVAKHPTNLLDSENESWLNFGPISNHPPKGLLHVHRCHEQTKCSISTVIRVHQQPIGVLHLESFDEKGFDELDLRILNAIAQNVSIAVQSISQPWPLRDEVDESGGYEPLSLSASVGHYHSLVKHIPMVMWRKDIDGKFVWVNEHFCSRVQMPESEIVGKTDLELFPNNSALAEKFREGDRIAIETGEYEDPEEPFESMKGEKSVSYVIKRAYKDVLGRVVGTQGMFVDITGEKYRQLFHEAPVGFHELDNEGRIVHINTAECRMLGLTEAELKSRYFHDFLSDHHRDVDKRRLDDLLSGNRSENKWHPFNLKNNSGETTPVLINTRPVLNSSGNRTGLLCAVQEYSAGEEIESALRDPDPRYLARIRELKIPVFCVDQDLKITFANAAYLARDKFGTFTAIQGKTGLELYQHYGEKYHNDSSEVLRSGRVLDHFEFHSESNGENTLVRVLKFPIRGSNGNVIGVQGVFWDYQDQDRAKKELSDALEAAKNEYRQIIIHASEGIFQSTLQGKFLSANPAMYRLLGYDSEESLLSAENAGVLRFCDERACENYFRKMNTVPTGVAQPFIYRLRKQNGDEIWVSESVQKEWDGKTTPRLVGFVEDVTIQRKNQSELRESLKRKQELLTMLSHQLRSPVWQAYERMNRLVLEMDPDGKMLSSGNSPQQLRDFAAIRGLTRKTRAVAWSIEMMSKLVDTENIDTRKRASVSSISLLKMANEAARDARLVRQLSTHFLERMGRNFAIPDYRQFTPDWEANKFRVEIDADLVEQCVLNLVDNAFKYSKSSSTIEVKFDLVSRPVSSVTLWVRNQPLRGLEIVGTAKQSCREKNWRSPVAKSTDADGRGLGLWFTDRIMTAHGGELRVEETDSQGWNSFGLSFPVSEYRR